jgi:type II secretory pathway pseudopilin PulG
VLLIMAILLAIAIPTFLGVTSSAHNRAAQSDLRNAFDTAQTIYQSNQAYLTTAGSMTAAMHASEPGLHFIARSSAPTQNSDQASVDAVGPNAIVLAALAGDNCWFLANAETQGGASSLFSSDPSSGPGTYYGVFSTTTDGTCDAAKYVDVPQATWQQNKFPPGPAS